MSKEKHVPKVFIDGETADRITLLNLKEYRGYLKSELAAWRKNPRTEDNHDGHWLHPKDVTGNTVAINALNLIIRHFGG